ncbi:MAG: AI-2E family transporter [Candidatus Riflebacteria bacterium]|nr:AI-2E family transporter [Candidatus Riflebacteria bacterium]
MTNSDKDNNTPDISATKHGSNLEVKEKESFFPRNTGWDGIERRGTWLERNLFFIKRSIVWLVFLSILYYFKSFLSLLFITFITAFTMNSLIEKLCEKLKFKRKPLVLAAYILLALAVSSMGMIVVPQVIREGKYISKELPKAKDQLISGISNFTEQLSSFTEGLGYISLKEGLSIDESVKDGFSMLFTTFSGFFQSLFKISFNFVLSMIFSFLILWDLKRLLQEIESLKDTRLEFAYRTLEAPLHIFAEILGKAFEAQIIIAIVNTVFTLIGLTFLGIPSKLFLSVFVFVCSFIPVLGVFISSIPICLIAYQVNGLILAFYSIVLITIIHFIEAYLLNPRIVGAHLSLHPFVAVTVLVLSEHLFGVWGLLMGVPSTVFVYKTFIVKINNLPVSVSVSDS